MYTLNLTQHHATPDQIDAGVVDFEGAALAELKKALTFDDLPSAEDVQDRAEYIAQLATEHPSFGACDRAMIGGAPFLMAALEAALRAEFIQPVYAFSRREVVEAQGADGSVTKTAVFRHVGFVTA
jgi:hypothetical protein